MPSQILIATDFSESARRAADFARELASQLHLGLALVHVVEPIGNPDEADAEFQSFHEELLKRARENLRVEGQRLGHADVEELALLGPRLQTLLLLAKEREPLLVAVGRNSMEKATVGIGLQLQMLTPCPVVSVP